MVGGCVDVWMLLAWVVVVVGVEGEVFNKLFNKELPKLVSCTAGVLLLGRMKASASDSDAYCVRFCNC